MPAGIYSGSKKAKYQNEKNKDRVKMLTGGQAKIAAKAPPPNKIDAKDFAVLRAEKAKGRGMGLQDEKVQPGKVMKAKRGSGLDLPVINKVKPAVHKTRRAQNLSKMKIQFNKQRSRAGINSGALDKILSKTKNPYSDLKATTAKGPKQYSSMAEMKKAKGLKPGELASKFNKRRMALAAGKQALKATTVGKIALGVGAAAVAAQQYLKSKKKDKKAKATKKMGGGMMKKYKSGGPVPVEKIREAFPEATAGRVARIQTMLGDKSAPMKKERLFEGDRGRRKELIKKLKGAARATPLGLGIEALKTAKKLKEKMSKKMGGGMMQKPMGYKSGTSVKVKCKLGRNKPTKMY